MSDVDRPVVWDAGKFIDGVAPTVSAETALEIHAAVDWSVNLMSSTGSTGCVEPVERAPAASVPSSGGAVGASTVSWRGTRRWGVWAGLGGGGVAPAGPGSREFAKNGAFRVISARSAWLVGRSGLTFRACCRTLPGDGSAIAVFLFLGRAMLVPGLADPAIGFHYCIRMHHLRPVRPCQGSCGGRGALVVKFSFRPARASHAVGNVDSIPEKWTSLSSLSGRRVRGGRWPSRPLRNVPGAPSMLASRGDRRRR
jgi:hypothetical protein